MNYFREKRVIAFRHLVSVFWGIIQNFPDGNRIINRSKIHRPAIGRVCGVPFPYLSNTRAGSVVIKFMNPIQAVGAFFFFLLVFCGGLVRANNIQVTNVSLTGQNTTSDFSMVRFDLTWENSWRVGAGSSNWDAAWVFVKYRVNNGAWLHASLNDVDHTTGTGTLATITPGYLNTSNAFNASSNPAMGVFIHRSENGWGNFSQTGIQLRWNYGINGVADGALVDIKVFAVEMVYVPQGSFQAGDGTTTDVRGHFAQGSSTNPFTISSENTLTLGGTSNANLGNRGGAGMATLPDDFNFGTTQTLPAAFPKGFNAFYCMKYEISQQQWVDFFNTLAAGQKTNRDITGSAFGGKNSDTQVSRNNIFWTAGDATLNGGTHGNVSCNFISWMDGAAFMDWAGLRPMTELEFEKACRGPVAAVPNEYAWGTTNIVGATGISNSGNADERPSNTAANISFNGAAGVSGPMRVGSFARPGYTREQSGASYYGIMDLSGNLSERIVNVGTTSGRTFTRSVHGNGLLTTDGFCDITTWPGFSAGRVTTNTGTGLRSGSVDQVAIDQRVSDRRNACRATSDAINRDCCRGARAVRTAP